MAKKVGCPKGQIKVWKEDMSRQICVPVEIDTIFTYNTRSEANRDMEKLKKSNIQPLKIKESKKFELMSDWRNTFQMEHILKKRKY